MENEERYFQPVQVENPNSVLLQAHESFSITNRDERIMPIGESDNLFSDSISVRRNSNSIYGETSVAANSINSQHKNHSNSYFNKDIHSKESVTNISILPTQDIAKLKPELERHLQKPIPRSTQNRGISQLLTRPGTSTIQLTQASRGQRTHCIDRGYAEGRGGNESFQVTRQNSTGNVSIRSQVPGNVLFAREQDVLNDSYTRAQLGSSTELRHVAHTTEFSQRQESEKVFNIEEHDVRGNVLQFREHCRTNNNFSQNSDSIHSPLLQKQYQRIISIPDGEGEESIFSTIKNLPNDARYLPRQILGDGSMIRDLMSNEIDLVQRDVDGNFRIIRRQLPQNVGTIQRQFPRNVEIIQSQVPRNVQLVNRQEDLDDVVVQNRSHMPVHASENRTEASTQQRLLPGYLKFVQRTTPGKMYIVHGRGEPPVLRRLEYHEVPSIPRELLDSSSREGLRRDDSLTMQAFNVFSQISNKNAEIYASNYTTGIELTQQDARNRRDTLETLENNLGQETRSSTSILERALLEPERRHSRESLLPTQIDNISFNECNQLTKMDKHASRSQSPEHSEGGDDWVDEDVVQESKASLKRVQHCAFCRNHNLTIRKYGHVCKFKNCTCLLCKLVVHSQTIMKHQQAHWRLQNKELVNNESYKEMKASKRELCDKCRNHSEFKERRGHSCPFDTCTCKHCGLTSKRRKVSKYLQRIRRANVTSEDLELIREELNSSEENSVEHPQPCSSVSSDRSQGVPLNDFVSCLSSQKMTPNEMHHFLYPRPHFVSQSEPNSSHASPDSSLMDSELCYQPGNDQPAGLDSNDFTGTTIPGLTQNMNDNEETISQIRGLLTSQANEEHVDSAQGTINEGDQSKEYSQSGCGVRSTSDVSSSSQNLRTKTTGIASSYRSQGAGRSWQETENNQQASTERSLKNNDRTARRAEDQTYCDIDEASMMNEDRNESYGGSKSCSAPPPINEAGSKLELVPTSQSRIFAQRTKQKRMQSCTFCQNHGFTMPKPGHQCPYNKCQCLLCRLTRIARIVMKHQQALWRHQAKELNKANLGHLAKLRQVCDKCRNHHQFPKRRGHSICPFEQCTCPYCTLTEKRRYVMMRIQRIRRGQITATAIFQSDKEDEMETADTDQGRGSSKGNSDFPAEGREVAAVIEGVTKALRALPSPVRKLSSQTAADHETLDESQEASGESEEALGELQEELNDLDESLDEIEEKLKALDATPAETLMDAIEAEPRNASSEFD
ncbi:uncharacterized protein LOC108676115 isoform X2 [Hyalella azteca]|uniref:Uncharacterized protein LOC108676115 isoform X2 n=1 Tax=Hyalella azteca TaxID=294128 RepID=A0A979FMT4_HYAAZ|nr:uncharacterized protein LOC108676115 isoform X2 [Hyalella azteca]